MRETISTNLFRAVRRGKAKLGKKALRQVVLFVESQLMADGSFMNKNGESDIYYTSFGWILSYVLGIPVNKESRAEYLDKQPVGELDLVHYAAYRRCRMIHQFWENNLFEYVLDLWNPMPIRDIDEFTKLPHNDRWSPYTQFLLLSIFEDTANAPYSKEEILYKLSLYHVPGGGYSNLLYRDVATTNATVAALSVIGQLKRVRENADLTYLRDSQDKTGGFKANPDAPIPDLLSTATALITLDNLNRSPKYNPHKFIEAHWLDSGGFSATLWDNDSDAEYTFYGLLALGTL